MEGTPLEKLSRKELAALVAGLQRQLAARDEQIAALEARIAELEQSNPTTRLDEAYSVNAEQKRREEKSEKKRRRRQKSSRRGRVSTAEKLAQATVEEDVIPDGFTIDECRLKGPLNGARHLLDWRGVQLAISQVLAGVFCLD